jgi:hypothetical protein
MAYLDTHEAVKTLIRKKMFDEKQAEAIVNIVNKRDDTLVTKSDLKHEIAELKTDLIKWFVGTQFATLAIIFTVLTYLK